MDTKKALVDLTQALRSLHQALVKVVQKDYEREWGQVDASQLLQLLTRHPQFEWLHGLSEFMVDVDALSDAETIDEPSVVAIYAQARRLISSDDDNPLEFTRRYLDVLQNDPALIIEHATVRRILNSL
ncbi:hypothetical protein ACFQUU_20315 [Herbaspirillum sp. GCM10030257]|uniref:hypothetical protein n=1 Tax=Herbaspirillum sp. GCM10030257 TaxID=3273393 RepID=UPI0036092798